MWRHVLDAPSNSCNAPWSHSASLTRTSSRNRCSRQSNGYWRLCATCHHNNTELWQPCNCHARHTVHPPNVLAAMTVLQQEQWMWAPYATCTIQQLRCAMVTQCIPHTYFQPRTVLQQEQWMSATVCRPVISWRSSLGPSEMFTLCQQKGMQQVLYQGVCIEETDMACSPQS